MMSCLRFLLISSVFVPLILGEDCELVDNCRLVDIHGDDDWIKIPGHYRGIQECITDATSGDTCLVRAGSYHEQITITEKSNIAIRGDLDFPRPVIDGTIPLRPRKNYDSNNDGISDGNWKEESIDGKTVCVGDIDVTDDKHPFQLFLKEIKNDEHEMMTNARWPNALWSDRDSETGTPLVFYNDFWGKSDATSIRGKMVDRKFNGVSPLADSGLDMKRAMAVLNVGSFNTFVKPIKDHNAGDDFFTYEDDFGDIKFVPEHNQYYLDSTEALLDNPGEWYYNMNTNTLKFMPWTGSCPDSSSDSVRGRVMDYAMEITKTDGIIVSDMDFFASNIKAVATSNHDVEINEIYLDSLNFKYPSSSKRMLQDYSVPKITQVVGQNLGTISINNCEFFGAEGPALHYWGKNAKVYNNLFQWNDWTGQMELQKNGGDGTVYTGSKSKDEEFIGNTLWFNGASAGFRPGETPKITNNLIIGQCNGEIMSDGAGVQIQTGSQPNCLLQDNWVLDSPKYGLRFDGSSPVQGGAHGTLYKNVIWNTGGMRVKGDYHNVSGNLALENWNKDSASLSVIHILRHDPTEHNANTVVEFNAAWLGDGGIDRITDEGGQWELAGIKSNNYYGNHSWKGNNGYDGSWVLNGKTVIPTADLPDLLMDVNYYDFRPKPDTVLTSTGVQIGPYAAAYSKNTKYSIAGRKKCIASFPIPRHDSTLKMKDALMFHPAYRCNNEGDKHMVYIVLADEAFQPKESPTAQFEGDDNIVYFSNIDITISSGEKYKWRVDCVEGGTSKRRDGDIWTFTMND